MGVTWRSVADSKFQTCLDFFLNIFSFDHMFLFIIILQSTTEHCLKPLFWKSDTTLYKP